MTATDNSKIDDSEITTPEADKAPSKQSISIQIGFGAVALLLVAVLLFSLFSVPEVKWRTLAFIGLTETAEELRYGKSSSELEGALDHGAIVNWVLSCTSATALADLPLNVRRIYTSVPRLMATGTGSTEMPSGVRMPNRSERGFLELSNALAGQRVLLRERVGNAYTWWQASAITAIVLGMLTTIAVSLSATEIGKGLGGWLPFVKVTAIILPIISTASAAFFAFYNPQADWSQSSRTNSSISQLHGQMAIGIWRIGCFEPNGSNDQLQSQLEEWSRRYVDIQTIATATVQGNPTNTPAAGAFPDTKTLPAQQSGKP